MKVRRQFEWEREPERGVQTVQTKPLREKQKPHPAAETIGNSQFVVNLQQPQTV